MVHSKKRRYHFDEQHHLASWEQNFQNQKRASFRLEEEQQKGAHITVLDSNLKGSVSRYLDIHQWEFLKCSCKLFSSWPKPPPPHVEYHLIKFYFYSKNDLSHSLGYCGVAKTLADVVDACTHQCAMNEQLRRCERLNVDFQFLHVSDLDFPLVPLIEFDKRQSCELLGIVVPAQIHRLGKYEIYGVKEAGWDFPRDSTARSMMGMELTLHCERDSRGNINLRAAGNGEAALRWFEGLTPMRDIDLGNLCFFADEETDQGGQLCDMHEVWLFRDRRGRTVGNEFTLDCKGGWAVFNKKAALVHIGGDSVASSNS